MKAKNKIARGIYRMPGSRYWWYRWQDSGKRYAVSLGTENEQEALAKKAEILADVERRGSESYRPIKTNSKEASTPITDLIDRYLSDAQSRHRKAMRLWTSKNVSLTLRGFCRDSGTVELRGLSTSAK